MLLLAHTRAIHTMEIHSNDVISASASQKVCDQGTGLGDPLAVSDLGLESRGLCDGGLARQSTRNAGRLGGHAVGAIGTVVAVEIRSLLSLGRVKRLGTLDTVHLDGACRVRCAAVALVHLHLTELVVQRCRAIGETCALRLAWKWRLRARSCASPRASGYFG